MGYGKYYIAPQSVTYDNSYYNEEDQTTKYQLRAYYKAQDNFDPEGYYSYEYGLKYYDGYGYNYYNQNKGYYEYSRPPSPGPSIGFDLQRFILTLGCMVGILAFFVVIYIKLETKQQNVKPVKEM